MRKYLLIGRQRRQRSDAVDREDQSHVVGRLGRLEESPKGPKLSKQTGSAKQELTCQHTQQVEKEPQMDAVMEH